jgi:hypothetical protein
MPVGYVVEFDDLTREQYDAVLDRLGIREQMAQGILYHAAGATQDGRWFVVDVWDESEVQDAPGFYNETLPALLADMKLSAPTRVQSFNAESIRTPQNRGG